MKILKNCNIIYFKEISIFEELIKNDENIFRGKIIISDTSELSRICFIKGILHVINVNNNHIPNEKIDCVVTKIADTTKYNYGIPVVYYDSKRKQQQIWCGTCHSIYTLDNNHPVNKYCSERCMNRDSGIAINAPIKDLGLNNIVSKIIKDEPFILDKTVSDKKKVVSNEKKAADKFQSSMVKDAIRLEYAFKRESYKREMRQPSLRKASLSDNKKIPDPSPGPRGRELPEVKICKCITKKGKQCTNKALGSSNFCGILSHSMGQGD